MLSHSFYRFYVITKFEFPKVEDLKLIMISYDLLVNIWKQQRVYNSIHPNILEI